MEKIISGANNIFLNKLYEFPDYQPGIFLSRPPLLNFQGKKRIVDALLINILVLHRNEAGKV